MSASEDTAMAARLTMLADLDDQLAQAAAATRRLRLGYDALAALVREEYPLDLTLSEIADTWRPIFSGAVTDEQVQALRGIEAADDAAPTGSKPQSTDRAQWQARALAAEAALLELTHVHHTCLAPSRLHNPCNGKTWADCPCRTCQRTARLLPDAASDWRRCECRARLGADAVDNDETRLALEMCQNARECADRIAAEKLAEKLSA